MTSDPFEEFEFRPLTEGLGFHKKPEKKTAPTPSIATAPAFEAGLKQALPEIEMPLSTRSNPASMPTPPRPASKTPAAPAESATVDEILKTLQSKRKPDFHENRVSTAPAPVSYRPASPDLSSFLLDGMLIVAASLGCLILLLMVTHVDLFEALSQNSDLETYGALAAIFAGVTWIYLVLNRVFLGYTPGEWVFDHRVGYPQSQNSAGYSLRVLARATLILVTGFVTIPVLSVIMGRDLAGMISGAPLLRKV